METTETLWAAPDSVRERLNYKGWDTEWTEFLLCGLYCVVAVAFLLIFGVAAVLRSEMAYAMVIFGFAVATILIYGGIWSSGQYFLARHFVVALMATLCLFLFYSGGTENTGPVYYFVFPVVAVFLQGVRVGSVCVAGLLLLSIFIQQTGFLGFDTERYSFVFISRIFSVYLIISILSFLFAWFRERAEREWLLSQEDLESITYADMLTGLANRIFMKRLIQLEFHRFKRYGSIFCLMAIKVDTFERIRHRYGSEYSNALLAMLAQMLMKTLRAIDIPARWDDDILLIMLPEATLESANLMAQRLRNEIRKQRFSAGPVSVSIGISQIEDKPDMAIAIAEKNLEIASQDGGNSVVSGRLHESVKPGAPGLSSYF
jgi:diguanylate cyclase (GGDEF)-like protein